MDCNFFSCHWLQIDGKEILRQDDLYYYTTLDYYDVNEIKQNVKKVFSLDPSSVITIQNIQPITKEYFELKTGKPFFL